MRYWYIYMSFLLLSCGASSVEQANIPNTWPNKQTLMEQFRQADTAFIIYAKEDYAIADIVINGIAAAKMRDDMFTIIPVRDDEGT